MTLISWESGQSLLWDFTCSDTLAPSNLTLASRGPAVVACTAEDLNYAALLSTFHFSSACIETLGAWGESVST